MYQHQENNGVHAEQIDGDGIWLKEKLMYVILRELSSQIHM